MTCCDCSFWDGVPNIGYDWWASLVQWLDCRLPGHAIKPCLIHAPVSRACFTYWLIVPGSSQLALTHWTPGKFEWNFRHVIFKQILVIDGWGISCEIALIWMSLGFTDDQSTLVQVMAWCRQATSHYLNHVDPDLCHHMASLGHSELTSLGAKLAQTQHFISFHLQK